MVGTTTLGALGLTYVHEKIGWDNRLTRPIESSWSAGNFDIRCDQFIVMGGSWGVY